MIVTDLVTGDRLARGRLGDASALFPDGSMVATRQTDFTVRLRPMPARTS